MPEKDRETTATKDQSITRSEGSTGTRPEGRRWTALSRRDPFYSYWGLSPIDTFRRWSQDIGRLFEPFGSGQQWLTPNLGRTFEMAGWAPDVEVFQRGNELVVRADLPGLRKEDVNVEISDNVLTIQGERRQEREEEREGWYRNERSYGSFCRMIPLPEGAIADSAKANFKDGVLEILMQAPSREVSRGRRVEITEGAGSKESSESKTGE